MYSKRLKMDITDPRTLGDFDLNVLVAELEGYKFNENGDAYERVEDRREALGYVDAPVYFTGNYDKMYRLLSNNQIGISWFGYDNGTTQVKAESWGDPVNCMFPVMAKSQDLERAIMECYVNLRITQEEKAIWKQV